MGTISSIIFSHNESILNPVSNTKYGCNCRFKDSCPLQNKCLTPRIVYRADVKNQMMNDERKFYLGVKETPFKKPFGNHTRDLKHPKCRNSTEHQNICGNSKMLIYYQDYQLLNEVLLQKCYQKHKEIFVNYVSLRYFI